MAAHQAPASMGFSRQEYWSGLPLPSPKKSLLTIYRSAEAAAQKYHDQEPHTTDNYFLTALEAASPKSGRTLLPLGTIFILASFHFLGHCWVVALPLQSLQPPLWVCRKSPSATSLYNDTSRQLGPILTCRMISSQGPFLNLITLPTLFL